MTDTVADPGTIGTVISTVIGTGLGDGKRVAGGTQPVV